jgi:hypothetical protein
MSKETTTVDTVEMDLDTILNPGADSVIVPAVEKPSLFSRDKVDLNFLNKPDETSIDPPAAELDEQGNPKVVTPPASQEELDNLLNEEEQKKSSGRPKMDKEGLVELTNKLIEKKLIVPFADEKPITDYTLKDFEELFEANAQEKERKLREEVPGEFYEAQPAELQYAMKYIADGGTDLKGLFRTLAAVEEVKSLDPTNENDHRGIVRSYLQATQPDWTTDEIEEEINGWDDKGELPAKAQKFKPKLDVLSQKQVEYKLQQQEHLRKQQTAQAQMYMDNIYKVLEPAEINGLKLDKKTQNLLFAGLVQPNYQSVSGKQTNLLGHLLERYQFVEPNHALVAEALWLLADPDGYKNKVREIAKKEVVTDTVRKLKTEESRKIASHVQEEEEQQKRTTPAGIPRPGGNFFRRTL